MATPRAPVPWIFPVRRAVPPPRQPAPAAVITPEPPLSRHPHQDVCGPTPLAHGTLRLPCPCPRIGPLGGGRAARGLTGSVMGFDGGVRFRCVPGGNAAGEALARSQLWMQRCQPGYLTLCVVVVQLESGRKASRHPRLWMWYVAASAELVRFHGCCEDGAAQVASY